LSRLVDHLFASIGKVGKPVDLRKEIDEVHLGLDTAIPLGFIVTELLSNCLKHAFPGDRHGKIILSVSHADDGRVALAVEDDGVGFPNDVDLQRPRSMGFELVRAFARQLGAEISVSKPSGARIEVRFPADAN
jgi:two-component sensor histidine kinase